MPPVPHVHRPGRGGPGPGESRAAATSAHSPWARPPPPSPHPGNTGKASAAPSRSRVRRRYLAHAALVLLGHGEEHAVETVLLLRRLLRAQPHPARCHRRRTDRLSPSRRRPEPEAARTEARARFLLPANPRRERRGGTL